LTDAINKADITEWGQMRRGPDPTASAGTHGVGSDATWTSPHCRCRNSLSGVRCDVDLTPLPVQELTEWGQMRRGPDPTAGAGLTEWGQMRRGPDPTAGAGTH